MPKDAGLGLFDDMDALLSGPRSDEGIAAIRKEAALAADRKEEEEIKVRAAAKLGYGSTQTTDAAAAHDAPSAVAPNIFAKCC